MVTSLRTLMSVVVISALAVLWFCYQVQDANAGLASQLAGTAAHAEAAASALTTLHGQPGNDQHQQAIIHLYHFVTDIHALCRFIPQHTTQPSRTTSTADVWNYLSTAKTRLKELSHRRFISGDHLRWILDDIVTYPCPPPPATDL